MNGQTRLTGKQIGNYRLVAEIASGGYGAVYTAKHVVFTDEPIVALKLFHAYLGPQERYEAFREAQILRRLRHPHILRLIEAGIHMDPQGYDEMLYLVTEFASQGSLRERLLKQPGHLLPQNEVMTILTQIAQALHYAHQQEKPIIHRDLKPENILFNAQGQAVLADFSVASTLDTKVTQSLSFAGTLAYTAPEQFEHLVSPKSDQYALGCIAYELFTGRLPFMVPKSTISAMWHQQTKVMPPAPRQFNTHVPAYVEQALLKAMSKERERRHADVMAFLHALSVPPQATKTQWLAQGDIACQSGQYQAALEAFEQALRLDPNSASAYNGKGKVLYWLNRYQEALEAFEQALRLKPNNAYAYNGKGVVLESLRRYEEALEVYKRALRLDPHNALTHYNKGVVLDRLKRGRKAQEAYRRARALGYGG